MGTEIWRYGILGMKWSVRPTPIKAIGGNTLFQLIRNAPQNGKRDERFVFVLPLSGAHCG